MKFGVIYLFTGFSHFPILLLRREKRGSERFSGLNHLSRKIVQAAEGKRPDRKRITLGSKARVGTLQRFEPFERELIYPDLFYFLD